MSYGQKPSAWARPTGATPSQQLNPNLFTNQLGMGAGQPFAHAMPGAMLGSSLNALVNQAAFSNMTNMGNVLAAQQQRTLIPQSVAPQVRQASPPPTRNQRTFLGTVTKLMETYGFVDEDVFFQTNVIRGPAPRVGDRVMVEASFNPSMPFKWNAYRIQIPQQSDLVAMQQQGGGGGGGNIYRQPTQPTQSSGSSSNRWSAGNDRVDSSSSSRGGGLQISSSRHQRRSPSREAHRSPTRHRSPARKAASPLRSGSKRERERSPLARESREPASRTRSPTANKEAAKRDESPPRRRQRIIPRYHCYIPKPLVQSGEMKYLEVRKRYTNLYMPSDFIQCEMSWLKSIQLDEPLRFSPHQVGFSVLHKDVDRLDAVEGVDLAALENPPDADSRYVVKVLLLAQPGVSALRQKVHGLLPDGSIDEFVETQSLLKNLHLLVGTRGKSELMCIGGAWSPSLDGDNPVDPQTQVNTAVRCTKALVGVDLSSCSKWYKMCTLHYHRQERNRVDCVVLLLPDTAHCSRLQPSAEEHAAQEERLREQLAAKLAAIDAEPFQPAQPALVEILASSDAVAGGAIVPEKEPEKNEGGAAGEKPQGDSAAVVANGTEAVEKQPQAAAAAPAEEVQQESDAATCTEGAAKKKTPWAQLNIKAMKVAELREELDAREIDSKGVKNILFQRLQEALDKEKAEEGEQQQQPESAVVVPVEEGGDKPAEPQEQEQQAAATDAVVVQVKAEAGDEQMETDATDKPSEEVITADELVEKIDDAATNEEAEKRQKELEKELEKAKEKFEKEKKEKKAALERHYTWSKEPAVLVYPSKTAKAGKFECKVSSLASLLDYRQDDNKEASFEVFLFAEALRESIDRANAFQVYHALDSALTRDAERKRRDEELNAEPPAPKEDAAAAASATEADPAAAAQPPAQGEKMDVSAESNGVDAAAEKIAATDENEITIVLEKKAPVDPRTKFKGLVSNVEVFSAFAHFDENVCGHIDERDMEEILYTLELDFSRGDVQRLVKKLVSREKVNYRNLTDKWVDKEGVVKYTPTPAPEAKTLAELVASLRASRLPDSNQQQQGGVEQQQPALGTTPDVTDTGVVFYKGTVLNIAQSLEQAKGVESERNAALLMNEQLELHLKTTKEQRDYLEKKKGRLQEDLDRYKKKLHETEKTLKSSVDDGAQMKISLQDCKRFGERISNIVEKLFPPPPPKKEEKSGKKEEPGSESSSPQKDPSDKTVPEQPAEGEEQQQGETAGTTNQTAEKTGEEMQQ